MEAGNHSQLPARATRQNTLLPTASACFGGVDVQPAGILAEIWKKTAENLAALGPQSAAELMLGKFTIVSSVLQEGTGWLIDSWKSIANDPLWHTSWALDVQGKWVRAMEYMMRRGTDPRAQGVSQETMA